MSYAAIVVSLQSLFGKDADVARDTNLQLLMLASVTSPLGSAVVSPVLDSLIGPLGVGEARIGLVMAVFTAPAIVLIPLVGLLADRFGRKPVLVAGLALFGAAGVALAFTTDFRVVLALRLLQGIGYTGIGPILITSVGDLYEGAQEATAQGLRFTVVGLSLTTMPLVAGFLVATSWRYPFLLFGVALPSAVLVASRFEEPADVTAGGSGGLLGDAKRQLAELGRLAARPGVRAALVARTTPSLVWFGFLTYNSIIVVRLLDGTPQQAGLFVALTSLASSLAATQVGRLTDRFGGRQWPLVGAHLAASAGLAVIALAPTLAVAGVGVLVTGGAFGVMITMYRSLMTELAPEGMRGRLVSAGESIGRLGSTAAPVAMGASIAVLSGGAGFAAAVTWTVLGVAVVSAVGGIAGVTAAHASPALSWSGGPTDAD